MSHFLKLLLHIFIYALCTQYDPMHICIVRNSHYRTITQTISFVSLCLHRVTIKELDEDRIQKCHKPYCYCFALIAPVFDNTHRKQIGRIHRNWIRTEQKLELRLDVIHGNSVYSMYKKRKMTLNIFFFESSSVFFLSNIQIATAQTKYTSAIDSDTNTVQDILWKAKHISICK